MTVSSNSSVNQTGSTGAASAAGTGSSSTSGSNDIGSQNAFLQLLVTQMQNQDPLNPMDNSQITSQLAQISTVTGVNNLNTSIQQLVATNTTSQGLAATSMIGHSVLIPGSSMALASGQAVFGANVSSAASDVSVSIKDSSGNVVHTIDLGAQPAGVLALGWDGTTDSGATAPAGNYTFTVNAVQGTTAVPSTALTSATVLGVTMGTSGPQLNLGTAGTVAISAVQQIL
jgi:flagellar basal-body rod modification protein FlgD